MLTSMNFFYKHVIKYMGILYFKNLICVDEHWLSTNIVKGTAAFTRT